MQVIEAKWKYMKVYKGAARTGYGRRAHMFPDQLYIISNHFYDHMGLRLQRDAQPFWINRGTLLLGLCTFMTLKNN